MLELEPPWPMWVSAAQAARLDGLTGASTHKQDGASVEGLGWLLSGPHSRLAQTCGSLPAVCLPPSETHSRNPSADCWTGKQHVALLTSGASQEQVQVLRKSGTHSLDRADCCLPQGTSTFCLASTGHMTHYTQAALPQGLAVHPRGQHKARNHLPWHAKPVAGTSSTASYDNSCCS